MEKISIIVPVYNVETVLDKCIQSILNQTYPDIELILVNDGSTDNSLEICLQYAQKDSRVLVVDQQNQGVSTARNVGITHAKNDWIMFVDSDDYIECTLCEKMMSCYYPNCDLIMCEYTYFGTQKVPNVKSITLKKSINTLQDLGGANFTTLYQANQFNAPVCKLYRKSRIQQLFDPSLSLGEDLLFNLHYLKYCTNVFYLNEQLYNYRIGNSRSLTNRFFQKRLDMIRCVYHQSSELFAQIFPDNYDQSVLDVNFLKEVCISTKKILLQSKKLSEKVAAFDKLSDWNLKELAQCFAWKRESKSYRIYLYLLMKQQYRVLYALSWIQNVIKKIHNS